MVQHDHAAVAADRSGKAYQGSLLAGLEAHGLAYAEYQSAGHYPAIAECYDVQNYADEEASEYGPLICSAAFAYNIISYAFQQTALVKRCAEYKTSEYHPNSIVCP